MENPSAAYGARVTRSVNMVTKTISRHKLAALCQDLKTYDKAAAFGLLKAECAAISLQGDLLMLGKQVYTNVSYDQQINYIQQAGKDFLILIFSYTGAYFEYYREVFFGGGIKRTGLRFGWCQEDRRSFQNMWPMYWTFSLPRTRRAIPISFCTRRG